MTAKKRKDIVQVMNPRTGHYVKIDRGEGRIVAHKKTKGAYKGIPLARGKLTSVTARRLGILGPSAMAADQARASRPARDVAKLLASIERSHAKLKGIYLTDKDVREAREFGRK